MTYFLMIYDRREGEILTIEEYAGSRDALAARFERERGVPAEDRDRIEIVVLAASSRDDLRQTHARYFRSTAGLVSKMLQEDPVEIARPAKRRYFRGATSLAR